MAVTYNSGELWGQIRELTSKLSGPFPYADCRTLLREFHDAAGQQKRYEDLIPDLNVYFDRIASYGAGIENLRQWDSSKLSNAREPLKKSFFQLFSKYRPLQWKVNQFNTPVLYAWLITSDQLRLMLVELIDELISDQIQKSSERQEGYLLSAI